MINGNKKGKFYEWQLVQIFKEAGMEAQRAWNSDGKALGKDHECDVLVEYEGKEYQIQAKRRKKLASFLKCKHTDIVAFREDRGDTYALMPFDVFLTLLKKLKG